MIPDLVDVLLRHHARVRTNTPLEVLAAHMVASLHAFEQSLLDRASHPLFAPGKRHAPPVPVPVRVDPDPDSDPVCGLYRDRPACAACDEG